MMLRWFELMRCRAAGSFYRLEFARGFFGFVDSLADFIPI